MTDAPETNATPAPEPEKQPERPPQRQRPKMSLDEQSIFLSSIIRRCTMQSGDMKGYLAGEAFLTLTIDDMLKFETVQQTLALFDLHGADEMVRAKIMRRRR